MLKLLNLTPTIHRQDNIFTKFLYYKMLWNHTSAVHHMQFPLRAFTNINLLYLLYVWELSHLYLVLSPCLPSSLSPSLSPFFSQNISSKENTEVNTKMHICPISILAGFTLNSWLQPWFFFSFFFFPNFILWQATLNIYLLSVTVRIISYTL